MPTKSPRLNVTVTQEQHALLLDLARLNGGSAAGYLRQMLDQATPLLRVTVPMLRGAAEEMELSKDRAAQLLAPVLEELRGMDLIPQPGLLDGLESTPRAPGSRVASASEHARTRRGRAPRD